MILAPIYKGYFVNRQEYLFLADFAQKPKAKKMIKIISDVLAYNNKNRPEYRYRVLFEEDGKKSYKVFRTQPEALEFKTTAKDWSAEKEVKTTIAPTLNKSVPLSKSSIVKYSAIERICSEYNTTLEEILAFYVKEHNKPIYTTTLKNAISLYKKYLKKKSISDKHAKKITISLNRLQEHFKYRTYLSNINQKDILDWLDSLKVKKVINQGKLVQTSKPISPVYYNGLLQLFSTFFNWCIKNELTDKNPTTDIEKKQKPVCDILFYSVEDVEEWLSVSKGITKFYIAIAVFTGIRTAELMRLKVENFRLEEKEIILNANITKTKQRRIVKIPDNAMKYILAYWKHLEKSKGFIFIENSIMQRLKRLSKKLTFPTIQNGFRHTAASFYLAKTGNEYETARQMGHSVEVLKRHYAGLVRAKEAEAFYRL